MTTLVDYFNQKLGNEFKTLVEELFGTVEITVNGQELQGVINVVTSGSLAVLPEALQGKSIMVKNLTSTNVFLQTCGANPSNSNAEDLIIPLGSASGGVNSLVLASGGVVRFACGQTGKWIAF